MSEESSDQKEITRKTRVRELLWTFLNSSFGLWLLATCAVGGGAWVYQQWRDSVSANNNAVQRKDKLRLEIAGRTSQFAAWLNSNIVEQDVKDDPPKESHHVIHKSKENLTEGDIVNAI